MSVATLDAQALAKPLLNGEKLYSPVALAKASSVPGYRGGAHVNGSTIFRHITQGVRAANGQRVRLEAVRVGNRWLSSLEALSRFSAALTEASLPSDAPADRPAPQPRASAAKAHDELAAALR